MQEFKNWLKEVREEAILGIIMTILENRWLFWLFRKMVKFLSGLEKATREKVANNQIEQLQSQLIALANRMYEDGEICFRSGSYWGAERGGFWNLVDDSGQKIPGDFLFEYFQKRYTEKDSESFSVEKGLELTRKICRDYRLLAREKVREDYLLKMIGDNNKEFLTMNEIFLKGKKWVFGKLLMWSGPIVEAGLMKHQEILSISNEFKSLISREGVQLFDHCHGNIIGNHIFFPEGSEIPHLLGMRLVIRPGRGYYDFLRALDWCLLELPEHEGKEETINMSLGKLLSIKTIAEESNTLAAFRIWRAEDEEIRLIFALRCIGVLGWDMLHLGNLGHGNAEKKKEILLRFIRREY